MLALVRHRSLAVAPNAAHQLAARHCCVAGTAAAPRWSAVVARAARGRRTFSDAPQVRKMAPPPKPGTGVPSGGAARGQGPAGGAKGGGLDGASQTQGPITWKNFLLAMTMGSSITAVFKYMEIRLAEDKFRNVGKAALGGPFELIDQDSKPFTEKDLNGKWALLYFGFTFCPDICPDELNKITIVVTELDKSMYASAGAVQPVLLTVDPRRDTAPKMKEYIKQFHPRFVGLTGTTEQVRKVTKAYRVYFNPTNDDDENYLVRAPSLPCSTGPRPSLPAAR